MPRRRIHPDRRLIGTWKSDRRRTFKYFQPKGLREKKLRALIGRMVIRWGRQKCVAELDGFQTTDSYRVVASDDNSVVIRSNDVFGNGTHLSQIFFVDANCYYVCTPYGFAEYFKRVNSTANTAVKQ
jgi:predicted nucleic-acid-binding Zn-ribbon protein